MEREPEIAKLSHIALATPDFEKSLWFWRDLIGLEEIERVDGTVYLRGWGEFEHHSLSLRPDSAATVDHVAWRTARPEDVDAFAERIEGQGIPVHWVDEEQERGQGRAFRFHSMPGQVFEIFYDVEKPPAPEGRPSRLLNQPHRLEGRGVAPRRIDHVNMHAASGAEATKWLQDTFGFKLREYIVDGEGKMTSAWLSVTPLVHDFEIRVAVQALFVELQQRAALFVRHLAFAQRALHVAAQLRHQRLAVELHVLQHFLDGIALDHRIENGFAVPAQPDMDRIGVAEEVVQIAQNLLVRAEQERAEIVVGAVKRVKLQGALHVAPVDECFHLAIGIACDVAQHSRAGGLLAEPVNRHQRKELLDGPAIRRSEERRVG